MNKLIVPPSPNWFASNILACAPDNSIIYGSRNEIVVIHPMPPEEPGNIQILAGLHSARVSHVIINQNWGNPNKWAVSVGDDKVVQLIDVSTGTSKISHVGHKTRNDQVAGVAFAGEDKVVSCSEGGLIIIWKISTNDLSSLNMLANLNLKVSTISVCPHASWLMAVGFKRGFVAIVDLKKSGRMLYKMKAHDGDIVSLSWCPTPHNIFPEKKLHLAKHSETGKSGLGVLLRTETLNDEAALNTIDTDKNSVIDVKDTKIEMENDINVECVNDIEIINLKCSRVKKGLKTNLTSAGSAVAQDNENLTKDNRYEKSSNLNLHTDVENKCRSDDKIEKVDSNDEIRENLEETVTVVDSIIVQDKENSTGVMFKESGNLNSFTNMNGTLEKKCISDDGVETMDLTNIVQQNLEENLAILDSEVALDNANTTRSVISKKDGNIDFSSDIIVNLENKCLSDDAVETIDLRNIVEQDLEKNVPILDSEVALDNANTTRSVISKKDGNIDFSSDIIVNLENKCLSDDGVETIDLRNIVEQDLEKNVPILDSEVALDNANTPKGVICEEGGNMNFSSDIIVNLKKKCVSDDGAQRTDLWNIVQQNLEENLAILDSEVALDNANTTRSVISKKDGNIDFSSDIIVNLENKCLSDDAVETIDLRNIVEQDLEKNVPILDSEVALDNANTPKGVICEEGGNMNFSTDIIVNLKKKCVSDDGAQRTDLGNIVQQNLEKKVATVDSEIVIDNENTTRNVICEEGGNLNFVTDLSLERKCKTADGIEKAVKENLEEDVTSVDSKIVQNNISTTKGLICKESSNLIAGVETKCISDNGIENVNLKDEVKVNFGRDLTAIDSKCDNPDISKDIVIYERSDNSNLSSDLIPSVEIKTIRDDNIEKSNLENETKEKLISVKSEMVQNNANMTKDVNLPDVNSKCGSDSKIKEEGSLDEEVKDNLEDTEVVQDHTNMKRDNAHNTRQYLLASSGRGSSIKIWRAGTDGFLECELASPKLCPNWSNKKDKDKSWITTNWATPTVLLSSSSKGHLLYWKLDEKNNQRDYKPRLIHCDHTKYLFCIRAPVKIYESVYDENWRDKNMLNAWTLGNDRYILNTSLSTNHKVLELYHTIGGSVTCLIPSPIDPTRIACGIGDGTSRLCDLSSSHLQNLSMTPLYDGHIGKISIFAWHPEKETCLAYGTSEGRVGLINTMSCSRNVSELVQVGHSTVHHLQWGPLSDDSSEFGLYTIANEKLVMYDKRNLLHAPVSIPFDANNNLSSFTWKPDHNILAVTTKNFELLLFNKEFTLMATFLLPRQTVRCMEWHPSGTLEENWLALCTNQVIIYDLTNFTHTENKYEECLVALFSEHHSVIYCIAWCPHQPALIASAGDDGMALVWNVKTKTLLHVCVTHEALFSVLWSPLDENYVITGGKGCSIRIWKLSEHPPILKIKKAPQTQKISIEASKESGESVVVKMEAKKRLPNCLLNGIAQFHNSNTHLQVFEDCKKLFDFLYSENPRQQIDNKNEKKDLPFNVAQLFGGKEDIQKILKFERENHINRTTPLCLESISMWEGDIGDTIKNAIKCETLNPWLVSTAPMVSYKLWYEACEAYAKQLANTASVESAYYYLMCHKVEEAIEVLCAGRYYREALLLSKTRLSAKDPLIETILKRWAEYSTSTGKYETAAQCYMVLNMFEEAARVLFRRTEVPILELSVKLAEKSGNQDLLNATRLHAFKMQDNDNSDNTLLPLKSRMDLELIRAEQKNYQNGITETENYIDNEGLTSENVSSKLG
ncbi:hypothetical protein FQA39_LY06090 [Lamprigera yunnana]|nr:hypothetical protein FQA39_LY06090 [Lamprigera yunnana]